MNTKLRRPRRNRKEQFYPLFNLIFYGHQGPNPTCHSSALGDDTLAMTSPMGAKTSMARVSQVPAFERVARGTVSVSTHLKVWGPHRTGIIWMHAGPWEERRVGLGSGRGWQAISTSCRVHNSRLLLQGDALPVFQFLGRLARDLVSVSPDSGPWQGARVL